MDKPVLPSRFQQRVQKAATKIMQLADKGATFTIISHYDADGIAAAGILGLTLYRLQASYKIRVVSDLDDKIIDEISGEEAYIFADIGSGQLDLLERLDSTIIVLDHHQPLLNSDSLANILHVSPHLSGIDGSCEISGSGVSYVVSRFISPQNIDLSYLAIVGALGDRQDQGKSRSLASINKEIVKEGKKAGIIKETIDLLFFGRETRPIHEALKQTTDPFLPGLTGNEGACIKFLEHLGIEVKKGDSWRTISSLTQEEKRSLLSGLVAYLAQKQVKKINVKSLIGTIYESLLEPPGSPLRNAREFASLLSACGRSGLPQIGVSLCMGDREALEEAMQIQIEYRKKLAQTIEWILTNPSNIEFKPNLIVIHGGRNIDSQITGSISSILASSSILSDNKAILLLAYDNGNIKASIRLPPNAPEINLGDMIHNAATKVGGRGGGHSAAAGATIPRESESIFISEVESNIQKQLKI